MPSFRGYNEKLLGGCLPVGIKSRFFKYGFSERMASAAILSMPVSSGVVLMYHEVLPDYCKLPIWMVIRESEFRWQMQYLQNHFDVVTMDQALNRILRNDSTNKPFASVTFDDGYKGNLKTVLPIMESMGLPFVVYVATAGVVDQKVLWHDKIISLLTARRELNADVELHGYLTHFTLPSHGSEYRRWKRIQKVLTWLKTMPPVERDKIVNRILSEFGEADSVLAMLSITDLQELGRSDCVTVGSHTHGHELLDQLEPQDIVETLQTAHDDIAKITGRQPRHFAFPNGNFNEFVLDRLREMGYLTAVTTLPGRWTADVSQFQIPRLGIGRFDTRGQFKARLAGFL